jgi:hypothetical protein
MTSANQGSMKWVAPIANTANRYRSWNSLSRGSRVVTKIPPYVVAYKQAPYNKSH